MTPLIFNLGPMELVTILVIVLLLFGGSRLAGLGKSTGRALKEFKEETKDLKGDKKSELDAPGGQPATGQQSTGQQVPQSPVQDPAPNDVRNDG